MNDIRLYYIGKSIFECLCLAFKVSSLQQNWYSMFLCPYQFFLATKDYEMLFPLFIVYILEKVQLQKLPIYIFFCISIEHLSFLSSNYNLMSD